MTDLVLALKREYFDAVKAGTKTEEFRLCTPYWRKRIEGRVFDRVVLTSGYPAGGDFCRRLVLPWRGVRVTTITHPHFGVDPVEVYAINVAPVPVPKPEVDHGFNSGDLIAAMFRGGAGS